MERKRRRRFLVPAFFGASRSALTTAGQIFAVTLLCVFWLGLVLPNLNMLGGLTGLQDRSVQISLQSALLGIDDGTHRGLQPFDSSQLRGGQLSAQLLVNRLDGSSSSTPVSPPRAPQPGPHVAPKPGSTPETTPPPTHKPPSPGSGPIPSKRAQTISFTSTPPSGTMVGAHPYTVSAIASSGLSVTFAAASSSLGVCAVWGSTVSLVGAGKCTINADQPGDSNYEAAPQAHQSFMIVPRARSLQAISFTSAPPSGAEVGDLSYTVSATATSGLPVTFSAGSSSFGVCTVLGSTVSLIGVGTCTIDADQAGNANYEPAPQAQQSFVIGGRSRSPQAISFTSSPPGGAVAGDPDYTVSAAATSGLPVTFSAASSSLGVCSVLGSTVSLIGAGTCTVNADQPGDGNYQPAPQAHQSFAIAGPSPSPQAISFTSVPPVAPMVGDPDYVVSATATSGLPVSFSIDSSSAGVCTITGSSVSLVGLGMCLIDADQAGNADYLPAPQAQQSFTIGAASLSLQAISFTSIAPNGAVVGGPDYTVSATATSGLPVTFSIDASSAGVCTISGSTISLVGDGNCAIDADQAGDASYQPAPQAQQSFTISAPSLSLQAISFTSTPPGGAVVGDPDYTVSATATSGLLATFTIDASSAGVCSVSDTSVSFVGAGTCTIDADQAGNSSYQPAPQAQQSFTVNDPSPSPQAISFTSAPPSGAVVGDPDFAVSATATSGLPVTFTIDASSAGVCTISGSSVSLVGAGTCAIDADQGGDASYQPAPQAQQSFAIATAGPSLSLQAISFTSTPPSSASVGDPDYTVSATATSGLPVSFTIDSSSAGVCTISNSSVSLVGAGTCTIDADQAGNATYQPAPQAQQSFAIDTPAVSSPQTINFTSTPPSSAVVGGADYTISATATSGLPVSFSIDSSSAGVCTIAGTAVSLAGAGTCTIDADQAGNASYLPAPQAQQSFTISAPSLSPQAISFTSTPPSGAVVGSPDYTVSATATSGLPVSFSIDPSSAGVCTITGTTVSLAGAGTCTIDANQAGNSNYQAAPQAQQSFAIGTSSPSLSAQAVSFTSTPPSGAVVGSPDYTVSATATSGLPVSFSIDPSSAGVCTISGSTVSLFGAGTCTVDADQGGDTSYLPAPQAQQSFAISAPSRSPQTISFTSTAPVNGHPNNGVTNEPYTVSATATSGLSVSFSIDPSSAGICSISGSTVSFLAKGICTIDADQGGDANYLPAPQAQQSFEIK